ncbi:DNA polymerase I [Candidatus Marinamargulisbacteria bacterium SCGC AG-343-K17]|nr:DNA polymerase I [Candidatus Marinamargulisbacteria bacterium SCGC AG-343-K17]
MSPSCDVFLIDGFSLLYRAYYGYPPNLKTPNGTPINAVYGFLTLMFNAIDQFKPTYFGICMDRKEPTYRHEIFPDYKAHRSPPDEEFLVQLPEFKRIIASFNVPLIELAGYESDDLLGTLSKYFSSQNLTTFIMSGDLDMLQLVDQYTHVVTNKKGVSNYVIYDSDMVKERYDLTSDQIIDFKALKGDASDNIPGVRGVGDKTATKLLLDYHTLDGIYEHLDEISSASLKSKLTEHRELALLSKQLVTIDCYVPIDVSLESFKFDPDWSNVHAMFEEYQFKRLISRIPASVASDVVLDKPKSRVSFFQTSYSVIDSLDQLNYLLPLLQKGFAFDLETTSLDPQDADIVAVSLTASEGISFVIDCRMDSAEPADLFNLSSQRSLHPLFQALIPLFEDSTIPKILHNAKYEYEVLYYHDILLSGIHFDTMLAAHLIDSRQSVGLKSLVKDHFNYEMVDFDSLMADVESILDLDQKVLASYVADDSSMTFYLYRLFDQQLTGDLRGVFFDVEMPLISVLADMELSGVQCDINYLKSLSRDYTAQLEKLTTQIYSLAGNDEFNINSTQQLADVLFDQLKLPVIKKTKTGRSTDSFVLEKLAKDYDIAKEILNYRTYKKLLSTYIDRLPELVHPTSQKIHTSFNQAITATGRLSSNHPNLQNIPVRSNEGQKIRCAFISRFPKGEIVSIDYSQIELRVLAHLSNDDAMMDAFNRGEDIHQATAAKVFNVSYDDVTKSQREQAKTVNFGITYGQSAFALSEQLSISRSDAQALIDQYFGQFSSIRSFMDSTITMARQEGMVSTMFGRIRMIDDIDSPNRSLQGNAQRIAINTRVQGSAADIIKKAMLLISELLMPYQSTMVMQVHDELVFDVLSSEKDQLIPKIMELMQQAVEMKVPLVVDVESGLNWGQPATSF